MPVPLLPSPAFRAMDPEREARALAALKRLAKTGSAKPVPPPPPDPPAPSLALAESRVRTRHDRVYELWAARPCFVCRETGKCAHRELAADLALVDAELDRARGREGPPVRLEVA